MPYIAGFVAPVPNENKEIYRKHAADAVPYFKGLGITRCVESWGDDVPEGKVTDFRRSVNARDGESIAFAWQEYPDRATFDEANRKMMSDPAMEDMGQTMPFDGKRMIWGGFDVITDIGRGGPMGYIDGSLIAVPRGARADYEAYVSTLNVVILEYGATRIVDAWGDAVPEGEVTDFRRAVEAKSEEDVLFSWVEWPSKPVRDEAWGKIFADPRMHAAQPPYDEGRRVHGGFSPLVDA